MKFPFFSSKKFLGIDIGTSTIKVVELSSGGGKIKLENYGEVSSKAFYQKPFRTFEKNSLSLSTEEISKAIQAIFEEAQIETKKACFSIPDYALFFASLELPAMTKEEIPTAVESEARRHIPIPLTEVSWDWQLIGKKSLGKKEKLKILLVAVPKEILNQYERIAQILNLEFASFEAETFSLARALTEKKEGVVGIIDIGARTTSCSIIEGGVLKMTHSFDVSSDDLTERIAKSFSIDYNLAEELKMKYGIISSNEVAGKEVKRILIPLIDLVLQESNQLFSQFSLSEGKEVEKIILAGGTANLPGLLDYSKNFFKKEVEIANPFKKISFPPGLEETLKEIGPAFSVAVGLALRGFE